MLELITFRAAGFRIPLVLSAISLLVVTAAACTFVRNMGSGAYPTICYVLPDGYIGPFQLVLDENNGIEVTMKDGCYTYEIPDSGVLAVKTFRPTEVDHIPKARYKNGTSIPSEDSTLGPEVVALRSLGTSRTNNGPFTQTNVVGTRKQAEGAARDLEQQKLKVGKL